MALTPPCVPESHPMTTASLPSRTLALSAAIATLAAALVIVPAVGGLPAPTASAATTICYNPIDTRYHNLSTLATQSEVQAGATDTEVGVYVEGSFSALNGAQETEGQFIVGGDANYFTHTYSNIGVVGIGSQVSPVAGTDVLVTGGDINVGTGTPAPTTVEVSHFSDGNIVAGGAVNVGTGDSLTFNGGGGQSTGVTAPLAPYAAFPAFYNSLSAYYAAQPATGSVTTTPTDVVFTGDGTSAEQVFTVASGSDFGTVAAPKKFSFAGIPTNAVIIVNVTAATATVSTNQLVSINGTDADWDADYATDPTFSNLTQSMFWNFPTATSVTFGNGSQIPGSIAAPLADVTLLASTNGRVYAGGDVELGDLAGTQIGLEMHNYSFRAYDCSVAPTTGSISVNKVLGDPDSVVDPDRVFTGTISCTVGTPSPSTWSVKAGQTATFTGIPTGSVCTIAEDALTVAPNSNDSSYVWQPSTFLTPNVITVGAGTTATVQVYNEVRRALGNLELVKVLDDPYDVVSLSRVYTGTFSCSFNGTDITAAPGTWSTTAGAPAVRLQSDMPAGAICTVAEDASTLAAPPLAGFPQYVWLAPVITPASVTIADGVTSRVTVTNIVYDPITLLASTGTDAALPLWIGGGLLAGGLVIVLVAYVRRRRSA